MSEEKTLEDVIGFLINVAEFDLEKTKRVPIPGGAMTIVSENYQYMSEVIEWIDNRLKEQKLNENQEIVLEYLKKESKNNLAPILMLSKFGWEHFGDELPKTVANAYHALNDKKDDIEVLQVFATWALDQC